LKRLSMMAENRPAAAPNTRLARKSVRNLPKMVSMVPALSCGTGPMRCAAAACVRPYMCQTGAALIVQMRNLEDGRQVVLQSDELAWLQGRACTVRSTATVVASFTMPSPNTRLNSAGARSCSSTCGRCGRAHAPLQLLCYLRPRHQLCKALL